MRALWQQHHSRHGLTHGSADPQQTHWYADPHLSIPLCEDRFPATQLPPHDSLDIAGPVGVYVAYELRLREVTCRRCVTLARKLFDSGQGERCVRDGGVCRCEG